MGGWGLSVTGISSALEMFDSVKMRWNDDELYLVGPTVSYAVYQEQGTSSIEARPFMRPAAERVRSDPEAMLTKYGPQTPQAGPVETLAIAVQNEAKRIADRKGVRDTGTLISSITYQQVN